MKHSIRFKLTAMLVLVSSLTIFMIWLINQTFLYDYYVNHVKKSIISTYMSIEKIYKSDSKQKYELSDQIASDSNMTILVAKLEGDTLTTEYSSTNNLGKMYKSMLELLPLITNSTSSDEGMKHKSKESNYIVQKNFDKQLDAEYLDLVGIIDSQYLAVIRTPIESIHNSAMIFRRFLAYVGALMILLGAILMSVIGKRFTEPIKEMAEIARKMSELDFDAKMECHTSDEVGQLSICMNELSEKLEKNISELKTANNELQKDIERKVQIDEMRTEFLSHVSHELKTPIALIQGYAEGLKENINDDEESREFYCDVIADEARKMNEMVKKLLMLNQIEFGSNQVTIERFDIVELLNNVLEASKILFEQNEVKVEFNYQKPIYVWADEFMIEGVITNYISNALNHIAPPNQIRITLEQRENVIRLKVFNSGEHIPEEDLGHIWEKFYKVDKARTREYGGSGIGLSIVAATMEAHKKAYGVENVEGGVEFFIELDSQIES